MTLFFSQLQVPWATKDPTQIPDHLIQLVSLNQTWISTAWMMLFRATTLQPLHKTYKAAAERRYITFCSKFGVNPLPATENILCYFVTWVGQEGLQHSTIRTYLSGVHQTHGFPWPDPMPILRQILQGVKVIAIGGLR